MTSAVEQILNAQSKSAKEYGITILVSNFTLILSLKIFKEEY
jgi:hypothetical protein